MNSRDLVLILAALLCILGVTVFLKFSAVSVPPVLSAQNIPTITARYVETIKKDGAAAAFAAFKKEMSAADPDTAHSYSHLFGRALYESAGADGVGACDASFQYGCYHGFFIAAVSAEGLAVVPALDASCEKTGDGYLPCQHGIGHGILEFLGHDQLAEALTECANIRRDPIGGCSSGVFMEYNAPLVTGPQGSLALSVRPFDAAHPDDPCPSVPEPFSLSCYHELPQWWAAVFGQDYAHVGMLCHEVPGDEERMQCFLGLGLSAAPMYRYDSRELASLCDKMPVARERALCRAGASGAVQAAVGNTAAAELCAPLTEDERAWCPSL